MTKKIVPLLVIILFSMTYVFAITASMGNARMVLRAKVGDNIEKYILVKNVNSEQILIEMETDGELAEDIKIKEPKFYLDAGEEIRANFTIKVTKEGTTESKINVKFYSESEQKGVGLSSTIIVIANKSDGSPVDDEGGDDGDDSGDTDDTSKTNYLLIASVISTIVLLVVFIIVYVLYANKMKRESDKKEGIKEEKTKPKKRLIK